MGNFNRDGRGGGRSFGGGGRSFGGGRGGFGGRNDNRGGFDRGGDRGNREMFSATCSNCGKECQVPFRPTNGKPVYCSDCFEKMGNGGRSETPRFERPAFNHPGAPSSDNKAQFDALNAKLDKILNLLQPKTEVVPATVEAVKEVEPVSVTDSGETKKAPKAKKTAAKKTK